MGIAYVGIGSTPLIDLRDDTVTAASLVLGATAHDASGDPITGTYVPGVVVETGEVTVSEDTLPSLISFAETHENMPYLVAMIDATDSIDQTLHSPYSFLYLDFYQMLGGGYPYQQTALIYAFLSMTRRATSTSATPGTNYHMEYPSTNPGASTSDYPRYWVTESGFFPWKTWSDIYYHPGRVYKWVALWKPPV